MIGLKVNGRYLDLPAGASAQTERNSPLTAGDSILGDFTYPMTLPATDRNIRELGFITELGAVKTKEAIRIDNAEYEEYNVLVHRGTLVAEFVEIDLNAPERGRISVYFLTAISSFYSEARNVMLQDIDLGGQRIIYDFGTHAKSTWTGSANTHDYVFAPIKNNHFIPTGIDPGNNEVDNFMNPLWDLGAGPQLDWFRGENRVMPFIYVKFLLLRCFNHLGYTVSGQMLNDPDFSKAYFPNFNAVFWVTRDMQNIPIPMDPVSIDLRNHVPRNYPVTKFLLGIANYFGWGYNIIVAARHCEIVQLDNIVENGTRKDMSNQVAPRIKPTFKKDTPKYALKLSFDGADGRVSKPDLSNLVWLGKYNTVDDLPAASLALDKFYALLTYTNWYYVCQYDEDVHGYMWKYLADNIYDYEPAGNNQAIETPISPVCQSLARWRENPVGTFHEALVPEVRQEGNWLGKYGDFVNWELRILFFHGVHPDNSGLGYPFSSSHNYTYHGVKVANYSLAFTPDDGIVAKFWTTILKLLSGMEEVEMLLYLNQNEYRALQWTDIILIRSTPFLLQKMTPVTPYNDKCPCTAIRLDLGSPANVEPPCTATVGVISVLDNRNGSALVGFTQAVPGATRWEVVLDGGAPFLIDFPTAPLFNLSAGAHSVTITPLCGDLPRPEGAATKNFVIEEWRVKMTLRANLTTGRGIQNRLQLHITLTSTPAGTPISFKFGQCVVNTSSGLTYCSGFPGSTFPSAATPVTIQGTTSLTIESVSFTAGANFGYIQKIVMYDVAGIDADDISKAAGEGWALQIQ